MYDSRTDAPRTTRTTNRFARERGSGKFIDYGTPLRVLEDRRKREAIAEGLIAYLDPEDQAATLDCEAVEMFTPQQINRLHAEALDMYHQHIEDEAWAWLAREDEREAQERMEAEEHERQRLEDEGLGYGWMPVMSIEEAREHFGVDFLGNGFHIDSSNAPRRRAS